jgi:oxygen-independent coproporphyrinogen III oxidase
MRIVSLSLYLHIPFCQKLCWYCGCHTSVPTAGNPVESYLIALEREIASIASLLPTGASVSRIHFGGGSPYILTPHQIAGLFVALRSNFVMSRRVEIAAELDPRNLSAEVVDAFAGQGLQRACLGVQTLDEAVQRMINRIQSKIEIEAAVTRLRCAGINGINFDLMYGLPGQTREHVVEAAMV